MPMISVQFGAGGVSLEREFAVAPRVGEMLNVTYGEEEVHLLVVSALHLQDPETSIMHYLVHCKEIADLGVELGRQRMRAGG